MCLNNAIMTSRFKEILASLAALLLLFPFSLKGEILRGTVRDASSGEPVQGAVVGIVGSDSFTASSDALGYYVISGIPAGRYDVSVQMIGYEPMVKVGIAIERSKGTTLDFLIVVSPEELDAALVRPVIDKSRSVNPQTLSGSRMISIEETERFAGAFDDVSRVVRRYPGITGSNATSLVSSHGNHPFSTLYRLNGIEIPTPMHFANAGIPGAGDISALHTNLLKDSDLITGAAPAEYGNTLGGVMDLSMREGNPFDYENSVRLSIMGIDLTSEGPVGKGGNSSYLISYRYGLTKLANDLKIGILQGDQGDYQDLAFNLNFQLGNATSLSVWGLALWDYGYMLWDGWEEEWTSLYNQNDWLDKSSIYTAGATLKSGLGNGWHLTSIVAASYSNTHYSDRFAVFASDGVTRLTQENKTALEWAPVTPFNDLVHTNTTLSGSVTLRKRFSRHYLLSFGTSLRDIHYVQDFRWSDDIFSGALDKINKADSHILQSNSFVNNNLRFGRLTVNAGLHLQGWSLSNDWNLQPRVSAQLLVSDRSRLSAGYALTSRNEMLDNYFSSAANRNLKLARSNQFVLNYSWSPSDNMALSIEAWAEKTIKLPVSPTGTYSPINRYLYYSTEELCNEGMARNAGISAGVEHYMTFGYYWLANVSLYKSEYRAVDGIWRPTLFDRGWSANLAGGKEWALTKNGILSVNAALSAMGGFRQTPFDDVASAALYASGSPLVAFQEDKAMSERAPAVYDLGLNVNYRINGKKVSHVVGLDYMNVLSMEEPLYYYYNYVDGTPETITSCYSIPNFFYKIVF